MSKRAQQVSERPLTKRPTSGTFIPETKKRMRQRLGGTWQDVAEQKASQTMDEIFGSGYMAATATGRIRNRPPAEPVIEKPRAVKLAPRHTEYAFDPNTFKGAVLRAAEILTKLGGIDGIVACGHSGLPFGGAVSFVTGIPLIAVRKRGEPTVASFSPNVSAVLHAGTAKRWVWIDDCICSGGTMVHSIDRARQLNAIEGRCPTAIILYNRTEDDSNMSYRMSYVDAWTGDDEDCPMYGVRI